MCKLVVLLAGEWVPPLTKEQRRRHAEALAEGPAKEVDRTDSKITARPAMSAMHLLTECPPECHGCRQHQHRCAH